jgi:hypothetical protein
MHQRQFFEDYAKSSGFDPFNPSEWYSVSSDSIRSVKVNTSVSFYFFPLFIAFYTYFCWLLNKLIIINNKILNIKLILFIILFLILNFYFFIVILFYPINCCFSISVLYNLFCNKIIIVTYYYHG